MNRSTTMLVLAAAVALSLGYWMGSAPRAEAQIGRDARYQLIEGSFEISRPQQNELVERTSMFKINTESGKAWRYVERVDDKRWVRQWVEIE